MGKTPSFLISSGNTFSSNQHSTPEGLVWFTDLHGQSDGIRMYVHHLPSLAAGKVYVGWLINPRRPDQLRPLSPLTLGKDGDYVYSSEQDTTFNTGVENLRQIFTQVSVTIEQTASSLQRPSGSVVLQGMLNQGASADLTRLFSSDQTTPAQVSLVYGMRYQIRQLERWEGNLLEAEQNNDPASVSLDLQRLIYIIEGQHGPDIAKINPATIQNMLNSGDGFGLVASTADCQASTSSCGYYTALRAAIERLSKLGAVIDPPGQDIRTALTTLETMTLNVERQAVALMNLTTLDTPTLQNLTALTVQIDALLNGVDLDGDGNIDAVPNEAAAAQLFTYLQQVGAIYLKSVPA